MEEKILEKKSNLEKRLLGVRQRIVSLEKKAEQEIITSPNKAIGFLQPKEQEQYFGLIDEWLQLKSELRKLGTGE